MRFSSILLVMHSLFPTIIVAQALSPLRPGCPETCGNITIPSPFGIGPVCSADSSFAVICNNTFNPPKAFLSSIGLEAIEFSVEDNIVKVMHAVSPLSCSSTEKTSSLGSLVVGSPFTLSYGYNDVAIVGCDSEVRLMASGTNSSTVGCRPICGYTEYGCYGINCCRITSFPQRLQELQITYRTFEEGNDTVCGYAFLADLRWLESDYKKITSFQNHSNPLNMPKLEYVPVALEWGLLNGTLPGVRCDNLSSDHSASLGFGGCYCDVGFEGNPYEPGRCKDIDECGNATLNNCGVGTICNNTVGNFTCVDENNHTKSTIIVISSGIGALLLLGAAWMSSKVIRKRIKANRKKKLFKLNGGLLLEQHLSSSDGAVEKIKLFNSKELAVATDRYNENRILGRGGQGTVYKGMLPNGRIIAVKKSKKVNGEVDIEVFINEIIILSQINHRNVVRLLGCCLETEVPLLVYEFIPNGTLFQCLHDQNGEFPLSWKMRVRIATEVAGALSYMHSAASAPIYHRDIKSTNILLDDKYRAKVSDFGTSRSIAIDQTHLTTRVLGTFGYLDPEYFQSSQFTEKSDVYSFGVVMVELLTGEKAISTIRAEAGKSLAIHFLQSMEENHLFDILDPKVLEEGRTEEIEAVAKLARRCLNLNGKKRPAMKEVTLELEGIQMLKEGSIFQPNYEEAEFHSIELSEVDDVSSVSDSTHFDGIIAESSKSPFLFGN